MIDSTPKVKHLAIDPDKHLVHMPSPLRIASMLDPTLPDLGCDHRSEPIPPEPYLFVASVDAAIEQDVLDLTGRQPVAGLQPHYEADQLR